jgi:photosystem II stability/assembly factor-like uncharacterized protein
MANKPRAEKMRHEVAVQRFASPLRDAAPSALEEFWHNRHIYDRASNAHWTDGGPCNFSGRATCLVMDPLSPNLLYAGSAAGGLWKSENGGDSWSSCWPNALSQNIGAVAIDPDDHSRIICGTGEGNLSTASYPGSGIYISDDGGFTWQSFIWMQHKRRMSAEDRNAMPRRVASIAFSAKDPANGRRQIAIGSISNEEDLLGGLFLQQDNGSIVFVERWSSRPYNCYSAVFHPTKPGILYAGIEAGGAINGIWRSKDAGKSWEHLAQDVLAGERCGRISLAISQADPSVLYALVSSRSRRVLGVFRSRNGGDSWTDVTGTGLEEQGQLAFNNTIAIDPKNPDIVVCGAQGIFLSTKGGFEWRSISNDHRAVTSTKKNTRYVHPDHHAIVMPGGSVIYSANDGGVAKSTDMGETWTDASHGMNTVMFYAVDVSPANANIYGGGAQDNGTLMAGVNSGFGLLPEGRDQLSFVQVLEGDGGYLVFDQKQEELVFASSFETETRCHDPGRRWTRGLLSNTWRNASPEVPEAERDVLGLTVMALKPADGEARSKLFLGTNRLWWSRTHGRSWDRSEFSQFDGSAITAIEIANSRPSVMFVGTANGGIFRSADGGHVWSEDLAGPEIPNRVITQIETHPTNPDCVVVAVASTGRPAASLHGKLRPYSHVFQSLDGGRTWEDIDKGQLPNVVFNGLAFETRSPFRLFVAGDAGPWVLNPDRRWVSIAGDMPSAVISDIVYHTGSETLTAGTYGRGIWRMKVPRTFKVLPGNEVPDSDALLPTIEGYILDPHVPIPEPLTPEPGQKFNVFPRVTTFSCTKVKGAIGYSFECEDPLKHAQVKSSRGVPEAKMTLGGSGAYQWRCWALFPESRCSLPSRATKFLYRV